MTSGQYPAPRPGSAGGSRAGTATWMHWRRRFFETTDPASLARLAPSTRRAGVTRVVDALIRQEGPALRKDERRGLVHRVVDEIVGFGILEPLLCDAAVTEIMVNGPDEVWIERGGILERTDLAFADETHLRHVVDRILIPTSRRVDEASPMVDARLPTGERVNVVLPPLSPDGPVVTIRRFPVPLGLEDLVARGTISSATARLLSLIVRARCNVLVSGGTGTGKTTLLNALSAGIPEDERIVTVEDVAELQLRQTHVVRLEARSASVEGTGEVTVRSLVRNAMRMRPDRLIVGEVRGGEAWDMLQSLHTGHEGSMTTVHAGDAVAALRRVEQLAACADLHPPFDVLRDLVRSAFDVVVQLGREPAGLRFVKELVWVDDGGVGEAPVPVMSRKTGEGERRSSLPRALAERLRSAQPSGQREVT